MDEVERSTSLLSERLVFTLDRPPLGSGGNEGHVLADRVALAPWARRGQVCVRAVIRLRPADAWEVVALGVRARDVRVA